MGPKNIKPSSSSEYEYTDSMLFEDAEMRSIEIKMILKGDTPPPYVDKKGPIPWFLVMMFNGNVLLETLWENNKLIEFNFGINLLDPEHIAEVVDKPILFLLRTSGGKQGKDVDPLGNVDNRAGGTVDLMPLVIGEEEVKCKVRLLSATGEEYGLKVKFCASAIGPKMPESNLVPLVLTMVSVHCLPSAGKEGTVYLSAIGLDGLIENMAVNFGMSVSTPNATKLLWGDACTGGQMLNSPYNVPDDDKFIPYDVEASDGDLCVSYYWNTIQRVLVHPFSLQQRLATSFSIEVAGVPRISKGKVEIRGRYMGLVDARALLKPAQTTLITCAKLQYFSEEDLPEGIGPLLDLPPASQKSSARSKSPQVCADLYGHTPYIVMRFDLKDPLVPKRKLPDLYNDIGFPPPNPISLVNDLYIDPTPEDPTVDVRKIRNESGALAVHKELSTLACRGVVPMNQGIKKTAANRLLSRVRTMLKQFSPGDCSYVEWQDTVTGQHAAARRSVTASFRNIPPPKRVGSMLSAARARMAGNIRIADKHIELNLEAYPKHPRILLSKALTCLEARNDMEANFYILKAINSQTTNKFLMWIFGGIKYDKGEEALEVAKSAFQIATNGDKSDGIPCTIAWAALHTLYHFEGDQYSAFIAAKKMRRSFELKCEWKEFYTRWLDTSGEEESLWVPGAISTDNPLLIASALFLCLRCYKFSELILQCLERGCATRGSRLGLKTKVTVDVFYLRAASLLLRRQTEAALKLVETGIRKFGPSALMSQMRCTCLVVDQGWDEECAQALYEAERAGSEICSALLLQAALHGMKTNAEEALQRAARAHKATPCAFTALAIARILGRKGESVEAEKWAAAAVKLEPWLADAWAVLALLAMGDRDVEKARTMLRTARQVGPLSPDIEMQLKKIMAIVKIETLSDSLVKNLCLCEYLDPSEV